MAKKKSKKKDDEKKQVIDALLDSDPDFLNDLRTKTKDAFNACYKHLLKIVEGKVKEERFDAKTGVIFKVAMGHDTRVRAAKVLKELTLDKMISDRKDTGREKDKGKGMTIEEAIKVIEQRKRAEAERLAKEGRLEGGLKVVLGGEKK